MSANITIVGRLGADPEIKFTNNGNAICSLTVVTDQRYKDDAGKWQSKDTSWWRVTAWRQLAENCADTLQKGDLVMCVGKMKQRSYETAEGEKRSTWELEAQSVGPDLARVAAKINRAEKTSGKEAYDQAKAAMDDPWAQPFVPADGEAPF